MKTKNILLLSGMILGIALVIGTLSSFTKGNITPYVSPAPQSAQWDNLKVLPTAISKDSLLTLMKGYNIALGVKCSYCHTPRKDDSSKLDFADDSKVEKLIARGMIQMTQEINANYFNFHKDRDPKVITDVTCAMCHRGTPNPKDYLNNIGKIAPGGEKEK